MVKQKFVIIGNSAAGIGALEAIRKYDRESPVTMISAEDAPLYSRCLLSYFIAGSIDEPRLLFRPPEFYREMNCDMRLGCTAESVDPARQQVVCGDGTKLDYDRLLIATGGSPKIPAGLSDNVQGVFVLRTLRDAMAIRGYLETDRSAVVLGGGLVGMKAAFALNKRGVKVAVVVRSRHVLSQMIDAGAASIVMSRLEENGIELLTGADVTGLQTKDGKLTGVTIESTTSSSSVRPCDLLIMAKGVEPNTGLISGTAIQKHAGITTNARMQTSVENIYAAGDVAETFDLALEGPAINALWTCAMQQGKIAGCNMAGQPREYDGSLGMNSINFPGVDLISFGVVRPEKDAGYEVLLDQRPNQSVYKILVLRDNRIKGLILVNRVENAGVLLSLLGRKTDVSGFKDELLSDRFSYGTVLGKRGVEEWRSYAKCSRTEPATNPA